MGRSKKLCVICKQRGGIRHNDKCFTRVHPECAVENHVNYDIPLQCITCQECIQHPEFLPFHLRKGIQQPSSVDDVTKILRFINQGFQRCENCFLIWVQADRQSCLCGHALKASHSPPFADFILILFVCFYIFIY
jgi:hypothetical protein